MMNRQSKTLPKLSIFLLSCALGASMSGCGLRLDTPAEDLPTLSAAQTLRNDLARAQQAIAAGAEKLSADQGFGQGLRATLGAVSAAAYQRLSALGGAWNPWPQGRPEGAQAGPQPLSAPANLPALVSSLEQAAQQAVTAALSSPEGPEAALLAGVAAANQLEANRLRVVYAQSPQAATQPLAQVSTVGSGATETSGGQAALHQVLGEVSSEARQALHSALADLDYCRYQGEAAASYLSNNQQKNALAVAETCSIQADDLVAGGLEEARQGQYPTPQISNSDSAVSNVQQAVLRAFKAQLRVIAALPAAATDSATASTPPAVRGPWIDHLLRQAQTANAWGVSDANLFVDLWG